ncbi:hypothetical protein ACN2XU_02640 [Primorskyibacter sp. 2E107]|uniref:hypothetical protein n=1 Tax=Primorskyibacter sp. 2E107 TaxID=3403458 RepID=UPI003AF7C366
MTSPTKHTLKTAEKSCGGVGEAARAIWSGFRYLVGAREKSFTVNRVEAEALARASFAAMLRHPFPGATDAEIARAWAPRLDRSERQVLNWLAGEHAASVTDIYIVGATLGVWASAEILVGQRTRDDILAQIGRS